jgi:divalent metal cation (Fe/Co/Zn/Cd) transporter
MSPEAKEIRERLIRINEDLKKNLQIFVIFLISFFLSIFVLGFFSSRGEALNSIMSLAILWCIFFIIVRFFLPIGKQITDDKLKEKIQSSVKGTIKEIEAELKYLHQCERRKFLEERLSFYKEIENE